MPNRPAYLIALNDPDRAVLETWARRRKTAQALSLRARIILACAEPEATNSGVARALGVSRPTVQTWRQRFAQHGPDGLLDEPRPGAPSRCSPIAGRPSSSRAIRSSSTRCVTSLGSI
jgi:transposase-like protein